MAHGIVLVTGTSTGIGETTALHLDRLGFRVFAGVRKEADGARLKDRASDRLTPITLDVTDPEQIAIAAKEIDQAAGPAGIAGLVNNAGFVAAGPLEFVPLDDVRRQFEVNVIGLLAVTQAMLPMLRTGRGRIVNVGSMAGRFSSPMTGPYHASKWAVETLTDSMRMELKPWGIHACVIEPGNIKTPLWEKSIEAAEELLGRTPQEAIQLYEPEIKAGFEASRKQAGIGISPERVARKITHALTSTRPKTRYLVGIDARVIAIVTRWMPDRVQDALIMSQLKSKRNKSTD